MNRVANKIERKHFGSAKKAWMTVEVSHDARVAFLRELCLGGDALVGKADVIEALASQYRIATGIDEAVIERVLQQVAARPDRSFSSRTDVIIARETPLSPARDGRIDCRFLYGIEHVRLPYAELKAAFARPSLSEVLCLALRVRAVAPGEMLAAIIPAQHGRPSRDIFGRITTPVASRSPRQAELRAGENVCASEGHFTSLVYGYACLIDDVLSVIPPVWVSQDGFEAHFVHFAQAGQALLPTQEWLQQALKAVGVEKALPAETVEKALAHFSERGWQKGHFLLVEADRPVPGGDAAVLCHFETGVNPLLPDGSVNMSVRKVWVQSGQLLIEVKPPTEGQSGVDLRGKTIAAPKGRMRTVRAGKNVYVEGERDAPVRCYAKFDGHVQFYEDALEVHPVLRIAGDVDEKTGDIDASQDVEIGGSIRAGVKVNTSGSVIVGGSVEAGASVTARGNVTVAQGICGPGTRVVALGDLVTGHIENCAVFVRRDIAVGRRIDGSHVRAGGRVAVGAAQAEGRITGGEVYAGAGVEADVVGGYNAPDTVVGMNADVEIEARLKKNRENIGFCDANILRIFRTLNIQSLDPELLKNIVLRTPPGRKKAIASLLMKVRELVAHREAAIQEQKVLLAQRARKLEDAQIRVRKTVHAQVRVHIGDKQHTVPAVLDAPAFFLSTAGIAWRGKSAPAE